MTQRPRRRGIGGHSEVSLRYAFLKESRPEMLAQLFRLSNLPASSGFLLNGVSGRAQVRDRTRAIDCAVKVSWQPIGEMTATLFGTGDALAPWEGLGIHTGRMDIVLDHGPFSDWQLRMPTLNVRASRRQERRGEETKRSVTFGQGLSDLTIRRPGCPDSIHFRYWIPNFIFNGLEQLGRYRNRGRLDAFTFDSEGFSLAFRQVADHKELGEKLKTHRVSAAITSVLEVQDVPAAEFPALDRRIGLLFHLMEAYHGLRIRPLARAGYDAKGNLAEVTFYKGSADHYSGRYPDFMDNQFGTLSWPCLLDGALPGFLAKAEALQFPLACWQMVEARKLCIPSAMAILLMCLESMGTAYLADNGESLGLATPIDHKLNRCNKALRCFPRSFTKQLKGIRRELRNPLFHQGRTDDPHHSQGTELWHDLFNACAAMLASICGYRGAIRFCGRGGGIQTVEQYAGRS